MEQDNWEEIYYQEMMADALKNNSDDKPNNNGYYL